MPFRRAATAFQDVLSTVIDRILKPLDVLQSQEVPFPLVRVIRVDLVGEIVPLADRSQVIVPPLRSSGELAGDHEISVRHYWWVGSN